jgi:hypothetical protein
MKNIIKSFIVLALLLNLSACSEDFLEQSPSDRPTEEVLFNSLEGAEIHLTGIYSIQNYYYGEGTRGILGPDVMGDDALVVSSNNYGRYVDFYKQNFSLTSSTAYNFYRYSYRTIANCNTFLSNIDNIVGDDIKKKDLKAQALTLRAFSYFNLVRWFGETAYTDNPKGRGVPIVTTVNSLDGYNIGRSTVGEVYAQILTDLTEAEKGAQSASYKGKIDASAVAAIQARVYLTMGEWANASKYAKKAYKGFTLMGEEEYLSGFNATSAETIWEQRFVDSKTNTFLSIPSFTYASGDITYTDTKGLKEPDADGKFGDGVVDYKDLDQQTPGEAFLEGYSSLRVTRDFINLFADTDLRKKMFPRSVDPKGNVILNKDGEIAYAQFYTADGYLTTKYKNANPTGLGTGDFPRIRAAEMYLIEAEAEAKLGHDGDAQEALFVVQSRADKTVTKSASKGQTLLDEIYLERRKELFFEGHRFFDLKRLDMDLDRSISEDHWSDFTAIGQSNKNVIRKNSVSHRFCLPIPQKEIDANEALTEDDQNEAYK